MILIWVWGNFMIEETEARKQGIIDNQKIRINYAL